MKIIKQFSDPYFYKKICDMNDKLFLFDLSLESGEWLWGLNSNGDLYCKCAIINRDWLPYSALELNWTPKPDLLTMKIIIKEFGHLLPFV